jgi:hypothetical protein
MEAPVLDSVRNLKISALELRRPLPQPECAWLTAQLRAKRAVAAASCDARSLVVEYDADLWRGNDLLEFLDDCGVPVATVLSARL